MTLNSETNIQEHDFRSFIELKGVFFIDTPVGLLKIPNRTKVIKLSDFGLRWSWCCPAKGNWTKASKFLQMVEDKTRLFYVKPAVMLLLIFTQLGCRKLKTSLNQEKLKTAEKCEQGPNRSELQAD